MLCNFVVLTFVLFVPLLMLFHTVFTFIINAICNVVYVQFTYNSYIKYQSFVLCVKFYL